MAEPNGFYRRRGKRLLDLLLAALLAVATAPLMLLTALVVRLDLGAPVLFRQERAGRGGERFVLFKFRTMTGGGRATSRDAQRLTRPGRLLRATSLDELPQLWNVLRGDMSLVGPRPLLVRYLERYSPRQARRHEVRPGLTGLAQVSGRNAIGWEERLEHDVRYVDTLSLRGDLAILLRTLGRVVTASGISAQDAATMPEFMGSGGQQPEGDEVCRDGASR